MRHNEKRGRLTIFAAFSAILLVASCAGAPPPKDITLTDLVVTGDINAIKKFYANQEQLNMKDGQGLYPLHYAVARGDAQIAEILIVLGAKPDVRDPAGKTPLRYAIDRKLIPTARMLVDRGADPFVADASGATPAEAALSAGADMIGAVFNAKNINGSGQDGRTILHMAADGLMVTATSLLIDLGASVQTKDRAERTALDLALLYPEDKRAAIIAEKLILKGANPSFPEFSWFATTVRSADYNTVRFSNGNTPMHESVSRFQLGFADFLLSKGLTPNIKNLGGDAPIHLTVRTGWLDGAELLLKNGADPDIRDGRSNTALHLASPPTVRLKMTQLLLRYKADPSLKDQEGNTALHKAVKLAYEPMIVEELLKAGTPVNSANLEGDTPLMICVKAGNYQYADALISAGADVFLRNLAGQSPLSIAVGRGTEAVDKIVLKTNVLQRDNLGNSVIATAVGMKGTPGVISLILSKGADPNTRNNSGNNALHVAVRLNLSAQGLLLINAKADIFASNATKDTPVFLALAAADGPYDWFFIPSVITARDSNGDTVGHLAARKDLADGLEYLRSRGTDLGAVNSARETLLHSAVRTDAAEATRYIIANGAVLSARDINGDAALNTAVLSGSKTCLQVLVLSGVDLNARNFTGEAALHQAVRKQNADFSTYLVDRGAKLEVRDNRGLTPLAVAAREAQTTVAQYFVKAGARIDARDYAGSTPLYQAVETGQLDLIRTLVQSGADILARNAAGDYPLLASLKKGQAVLREILGNASMDRADSEGKTPLRLLVETRAPSDMLSLALSAGADPSSRDKFANTPLHAALGQKDYATAALLLTSRADPYAPNYQGVTPAAMALADPAALKDFALAAGLNSADILGEVLLHYAVRAGKADAVKLLLDLGADRNAKNISGETAMDVAKTKADAPILVLFQ
jgi:ankyrin repeat protein